MARIGVFICHCGENISATVDCEKVSEQAAQLPGVAYSTDYKYMCSDPGQSKIKDAIREHKLTGVVVAACSPRMHEPTFRKACAEAGLNPYLCEMANIREHCSWVHEKGDATTKKAFDLVRTLVEKVKNNHPLESIKVPVNKTAIVIGGGVAGIQASLDIANGGHKVILVEKQPSIGGHMSQLSETFPTLDCSQCILTPRMVEVAQHPNITLYTCSEVESMDGFIGNFNVKIRKKAKSVNAPHCPACPVLAQGAEEPEEAPAKTANDVGETGNIVFLKGIENFTAQVEGQDQDKSQRNFALVEIGKRSQEYHHKNDSACPQKPGGKKQQIHYAGDKRGCCYHDEQGE